MEARGVCGSHAVAGVEKELARDGVDAEEASARSESAEVSLMDASIEVDFLDGVGADCLGVGDRGVEADSSGIGDGRAFPLAVETASTGAETGLPAREGGDWVYEADS